MAALQWVGIWAVLFSSSPDPWKSSKPHPSEPLPALFHYLLGTPFQAQWSNVSFAQGQWRASTTPAEEWHQHAACAEVPVCRAGRAVLPEGTAQSTWGRVRSAQRGGEERWWLLGAAGSACQAGQPHRAPSLPGCCFLPAELGPGFATQSTVTAPDWSNANTFPALMQ